MRGDVSLLKLMSNVSVLFGVMNFLIGAISENNADMVFPDNLYPLYNVTPISYNVTLTLDQERQREECDVYFSGKCDIQLLVNETTDRITMHAQRSTLDIFFVSVIVTGSMKNEYSAKQIIHHSDKNLLEIYFTIPIYNGTYNYVLKLFFGSCINNTDVFKIPYVTQKPFNMSLLATHLLPTRTRVLFPCFDDIRLKARFNIVIILDEKYDAVSNTRRQDVSYEGLKENTKIISFDPTSYITTYDVAIVIYDQTFLCFDFIRCRPEVTSHIEFAQAVAVNVTYYLKNIWEILRILPSSNNIAIPGLPYDAMMKRGFSIFREEALLYKLSAEPFATKIGVARLVSRVVVHEMLNNRANAALWDNLWINEAIATLLGQHIINELLPKLRLFDLFIVQFHQESLRLDTESIMGPFKPTIKSGTRINSLFSFSQYIKVPVILNMLRRVISDDIFWKVMQNYFTNYAEASFDNFCNAVESTIEEAKLTVDVPFSDVSLVMHIWANQMHYHVVNVIQETNSSRIKIRTNSDTGLYLDHLLVTMSTQSDLNFALRRVKIHEVWVEREGEYVLPYFSNPNENDWIMFNCQQLGYYRVKYQNENWRKIAIYLNSENYTNIPVLNRAQIMDDAFYFVMTDQMDLTIFFELMNYLPREKDYVVWYSVFKGFELLSGYLPYEDSTFFKEKFEIVLSKLLPNIVWRSNIVSIDNDNFTDCFKQEVTKWACYFGSLTCKHLVNYINIIILVNYIRGPGNITIHILPWWKNWVYCTGLTITENSTWEELLFTYLDDTDNKVIEFLACAEDPRIIQTYMSLIAYNETVRDRIKNKGIKMFINIFHSIVERQAKTTLVLEYILDNFDSVIPRQIGAMVALTDIINHIYSKRHLVKITDFLLIYNLQSPDWIIKKMLLRTSQINNQELRFSNLKRMKETIEND